MDRQDRSDYWYDLHIEIGGDTSFDPSAAYLWAFWVGYDDNVNDPDSYPRYRYGWPSRNVVGEAMAATIMGYEDGWGDAEFDLEEESR